MKVSVVVTTKNRRDELRRALQSCCAQSEPHELRVIDDGSTDGTAEMVASEFPDAVLIRHETSAGLIVRRNEAFQQAAGDIVFSIDDDAEFSTGHAIRQTLADFDNPRIAVVAIPLLEPNYEKRRLQFAPDRNGTWIADSFKGTAFAIRREVFQRIGGFRGDLVHQGEETDLAVRLLDEGLLIRLGRADPIIHYESPKRDLRRTHFYGRRNDVLFAFMNVPALNLPLHLMGTTVNGIRTMMRVPQPHAMVHGLFLGWVDGIRLLKTRRPVCHSTYRRFRRLRAAGPLRYAEF